MSEKISYTEFDQFPLKEKEEYMADKALDIARYYEKRNKLKLKHKEYYENLLSALDNIDQKDVLNFYIKLFKSKEWENFISFFREDDECLESENPPTNLIPKGLMLNKNTYISSLKAFTHHDKEKLSPRFDLFIINYLYRIENGLTKSPGFKEKEKIALSPENMKMFLEMIWNRPLVLQWLNEGLASFLGRELNSVDVDIHYLVEEIFKILKVRNLLYGEVLDYKGNSLSSNLKLQNNIPQNMKIRAPLGSLFLTIYNLLKNPATIVWDVMSKSSITSTYKDESKRISIQNKLVKILQGEKFTITVGLKQTDNVDVLEISDNGLGADLTVLMQNLKELIRIYGKSASDGDGIKLMLENRMVSKDFAKKLSVWKEKPMVFYPHILSNFDEILTMARLSIKGHSGLGLWAILKMLETNKLGMKIGEKYNGGMDFQLIFPKKGENPAEVVKNYKKQITSLDKTVPQFKKVI